MPNAPVPARATGLPAHISPNLRHRVEQAIEELIALLDEADGDSDREPSLGWSGAETPPVLKPHGPIDDREWDPAEAGGADQDGALEQFGRRVALCG
ncbi:MAG: hypothetical protein KAG89_12205 [Fulvimarina manganoxydans]|uniref:hypothetical protein n=1 Tax=Fulvimarina manganoxydans TaxID=937218 RepID=UPI00235787B8|nr:hypothetical protein [Fulvimarina manganoxydans]MCK5932921.1 hypothetical protein [Fulvimarina manganoxydans]